MILDENLRLAILKGKRIYLTKRESQILSILITKKKWMDLDFETNLWNTNISAIVCRANKKIMPYYRIVSNHQGQYSLRKNLFT